MLGNPSIAFKACQSIADTERLGLYIREFYIYQDSYRRVHNTTLPLHFWEAVQAALVKMHNLELLYVHDPAGCNTFILDSARIKFQLRHAQFHLDWDQHMVEFLSTQRCLEILQVTEGPDILQPQLPHDALPVLRQFTGTITVAAQLLTSPLTHMQLNCDNTTYAFLDAFISRLFDVRSSLRSLSILEIPDAMAVDMLRTISVTCPQLQYVGVLSFPSRHVSLLYFYCVNHAIKSFMSSQRERFHRSLMSFPYLRAMEIDITKWDPQPTGILQKVITTELRMFCPSVEVIAIWVGLNRFLWSLEGDNWGYLFETGQNSRFEPIWKNV